MSNSPLHLEKLVFIKTSIEVVPGGEPNGAIGVETRTDVGPVPDLENAFRVGQSIRLVSQADAPNPPYSGEVQAIAIVRVHPKFPKDEHEKLAFISGASIVYSAVREMVANITARGPAPMVTMPTINFVDVYNRRVASKAAGEPPKAKGGSAKPRARGKSPSKGR